MKNILISLKIFFIELFLKRSLPIIVDGNKFGESSYRFIPTNSLKIIFVYKKYVKIISPDILGKKSFSYWVKINKHSMPDELYSNKGFEEENYKIQNGKLLKRITKNINHYNCVIHDYYFGRSGNFLDYSYEYKIGYVSDSFLSLDDRRLDMILDEFILNENNCSNRFQYTKIDDKNVSKFERHHFNAVIHIENNKELSLEYKNLLTSASQIGRLFIP